MKDTIGNMLLELSLPGNDKDKRKSLLLAIVEDTIIKIADRKLKESSKKIDRFIKNRLSFHIKNQIKEQFKMSESQIDKFTNEAKEISQALDIVKQQKKQQKTKQITKKGVK